MNVFQNTNKLTNKEQPAQDLKSVLIVKKLKIM